MTEADSGSNGDNGQVTNPAENPSDSGNGGGANTNPTESKATYTITFDANGGSGEMKAQTAESGSEITLAANAFTRDGWTFSGWATSAGVGVSYSDKAKITLTGDITLYATWGMTAASAVTAIADLTEEGTHTVTVAGEISSDDMTELANAISGLAENVKIILDLGDTTGLTDIPAEFDLENLAGIVIPASVTKLSCLFWNNYNLSVLKVAENNPAYKSVGNIIYTKDGQTLVLAAKNLTEVTIPSGVKTIGSWAFRQNFNLKKVSFEEGIVLETIEDNAFDSCGILTEITLPSTLRTLGEYVFICCFELKSITLPEGIKAIPTGAFTNCRSFTEISLPSTLESIGDFTFGNTKLSVVKYNGTKSGWDNINKGNNNNDLDNAAVICMGSDPKEVYAPADKAAAAIATLESGTKANRNICTVKITSREESDKDFLKEIGEKIESRYAEYVCINLDLSATSITEIPEKAFYGVSLLEITLPDSLDTIRMKAFKDDYKLKKIVIPDNVRIIEAESFNGCLDLAEITLPASLTNIGEYAFDDCVSLKTVKYGGTKAQWEALKANISEGNDKLTGAKIICSDGIINGE
ncbi:leucine-rich repeat protein [Treponema succinifaciens]|uniref:leucine-rich repeat protein n=1 Tax=Treponema succinifaciens TaxID=167 RepID=UPI003F81AA03